MESGDLQERTYQFSLRVIKLVGNLGNAAGERHVADQLFRAGTSVAANYRAARRGKSKKDFIAKLGIVLEEADECQYWLSIIIDTKMMKDELVKPLLTEAGELTAIFTTSIKSARERA
ncbi:four helix bundle protein [Oceaniferula spumae]|uniref:Four helix bundle protein n=1 Tax=Oceaniferula spumae TaxID=2979115 RepID=A0AAT9FLZ1_9BACT